MKDHKAIRLLCETALGVALVVLAQLLGKLFPAGAVVIGPLSVSQLITGSLVNCVLFVFAAQTGPLAGICIGLFSSLLAFLLGIGPALVQVVPVIACGNAILAGLFGLSCRKNWKREIAMVACAVLKCAFLWVRRLSAWKNAVSPSNSGRPSSPYIASGRCRQSAP